MPRFRGPDEKASRMPRRLYLTLMVIFSDMIGGSNR
jgi:hypothetical protein